LSVAPILLGSGLSYRPSMRCVRHGVQERFFNHALDGFVIVECQGTPPIVLVLVVVLVLDFFGRRKRADCQQRSKIENENEDDDEDD
jgi:hypothetical protein